MVPPTGVEPAQPCMKDRETADYPTATYPRTELNCRPLSYQESALTTELRGRENGRGRDSNPDLLAKGSAIELHTHLRLAGTMHYAVNETVCERSTMSSRDWNRTNRGLVQSQAGLPITHTGKHYRAPPVGVEPTSLILIQSQAGPANQTNDGVSPNGFEPLRTGLQPDALPTELRRHAARERVERRLVPGYRPSYQLPVFPVANCDADRWQVMQK